MYNFFTILTINNSEIGDIVHHPKEFTDSVLKACSGTYYKLGKDKFGIGIHENMVRVQKPKFYNESSVFVFNEGMLHEMNVSSSITNEFKEHNREEYNKTLKILEDQLNLLKGSNKNKIVVEKKEPVKSSEDVVKEWLVENNIPITIAKLKKYKPIDSKTK